MKDFAITFTESCKLFCTYEAAFEYALKTKQPLWFECHWQQYAVGPKEALPTKWNAASDHHLVWDQLPT